jgi:hypothetical protein
VQYATELGARLQAAKQTLSDFAKVQLDLTDPALKLQNVWVNIVEIIARAASTSANVVDNMAKATQTAGESDFWKKVTSDWKLPGQMTNDQIVSTLNDRYGVPSTAQETTEQQRARGLSQLSAAMGNSFGARFSGAISELANPSKIKDVKKLTGEFDRLSASIERHMAATEADALTQGKSAGEVVRLRTEFRLMEAAQQDIIKNGGSLDDYAERIKKLADRAGDAAQNLTRASIASDIKFDRATIGLTDEDARIAGRLRGLYGDDIPTAINSSEVAAMRLNNSLRTLKGTAEDFATSFVDGLLAGNSASEALNSSLKGLTKTAADATVKNLLSGNVAGAAVKAVAACAVVTMFGRLVADSPQPANDNDNEGSRSERDQRDKAASRCTHYYRRSGLRQRRDRTILPTQGVLSSALTGRAGESGAMPRRLPSRVRARGAVLIIRWSDRRHRSAAS